MTFIRRLKHYKYILSAVSYVGLLVAVYIQFVSRFYEYAGFAYIYSPSKTALVLGVISAFLAVMPRYLKSPSDFYLNLLFFLVFVPLALLYCLAGQDGLAFYSITLGITIIFAVCSLQLPRLHFQKVVKTSFPLTVLILVSILLFTCIAQSLLAGKLWFNFSLNDVYLYRMESSDMIDIGVFSYLNVWVAKVILPVLIALSVWPKKYKQTALLCLLSVYLFGISQHKSVLLYPFVTIGVLLLFRNRKGLWLLPFCFSILIFAVMLVYNCTNDIFLPSMLARRVLFVPAYLVYKYHEFFSQNEFVFWSSSFMKPLIDYPYDINPAKLIGQSLGTDSNANNNFLATGFMHAGYIGLYLYCALVGFIFKLIDFLAWRRIPIVLAVSLTIVPMFTLLTSGDLPTTLATHGLAVSLIILYLFRSYSYANRIYSS